MSNNVIYLENPHTGHLKEAPVGYSWTTLFFGGLPALFRGDWKWFVIITLLCLATWGCAGIVFSFLYNKLYLKDLIGSGFKVKSVKMGTLEQLRLATGLSLPELGPA
ncbi:hypothetical protein D9M68_100180 [compost metagenome]